MKDNVAPSLHSGKNRILLYALLLLFLIGVDQISKYLAVRYLSSSPPVALLEPIIGLNYVENAGAAWGMLSGQRFFLLCTPVVAAIALIVIFLKTLNMNCTYLSAGLIAILSGGIGNLVDRIVRGGFVVDFLEFRFINFPVFNFADVCVTVGGIAVGLYLLFNDRRKNE